MTNKKNIHQFLFLHFTEIELSSIKSKPPAVSAFQTFESFLLLTALGQFPQALTTLASSLESAAKSFNQEGSDVRTNLSEALGTLNCLVPKDFLFKLEPDRTFFRDRRNHLAHYGSSPEDDEDSIRCSFGTGIPLFYAWAKYEQGIDIFENQFGRIIKMACHLVQSPANKYINPKQAIQGVRHWMNHHIRESFMSKWEISVLDADESSFGTIPVSGFDYKRERLIKLQNDDPNITISCPVCESSNSFVVKLNNDSLISKKSELKPESGECVTCDFRLNDGAQKLTLELCKQQLTEELLNQTLKEYGIN